MKEAGDIHTDVYKESETDLCHAFPMHSEPFNIEVSR